MKKLETNQNELKQVYDLLVDVCLNNHPIGELKPYISDEFMAYGSALDEVLYGWSGLEWMVNRQRQEIQDNQVSIKRIPIFHRKDDDQSAFIVEEFEFTIATGDGNHGFTLRLSTFFEFQNNVWIITHFHGSTADSNTSDGHAWPIEEWKRRNAELQREVDNRTRELLTSHRELEIEAALEKVRTHTMAMQQPNELHKVVTVVVEKLKDLGVILDANGVILCTYFPDSRDVLHWIASPDFTFSGSYLLPYFDHPIFEAAWESKLSGDDYFSKSFTKEEKDSFFRHAFEHSDYQHFPDEFKEWVFQNDKHSLSFAWSENSAILVPSHTGILPSKEDIAILKRFAQVFEQAYVRFLDLQKREKQARSAQIEAALERVRSSTMAMQQSDQLLETAEQLYKEFNNLGLPPFACGYLIYRENDHEWDVWMTNPVDGALDEFWKVPVDADHILLERYESWKKGDTFHVAVLEGEANKTHHENVAQYAPHKKEMLASLPEKLVLNSAHFKFGHLLVISQEVISDEIKSIIARFAHVFQQTYTRFLDLKKAETQAREAQIELSLERIRAMSTAMQESDDLLEIVVKMRTEFVSLGFDAYYFWHMKWLSDTYQKAMTSGDGTQIGTIMELPRKIHTDDPLLAEWESSDRPTVVYVMNVEETIDYVRKMREWGDFERVDPHMPSDDDIRHIGGITYIMARTKHGEIGYALPGMVSDPPTEAVHTLTRFAETFDLAYRRFEDLKKAEANARETQMELSLERIRAQVTAMQESSDLFDIVVAMRKEFISLGHEADYFWHMRYMPDQYEMSMTSEDGNRIGMVITVPKFVHENIEGILEWEESGEPYHVVALNAEEAWNYIDNMNKFGKYQTVDPQAPTREIIEHLGGLTFVLARTTHGEIGYSLPGQVHQPPQDSKETLIRFAGVFDLAYKRFEDLRDAEKRHRESKIELALERARAQSMMMQHSDELNTTAHVFHEQLLLLGIPTEFSYVWLPDEASMTHMFWASWTIESNNRTETQSNDFTYPLDKSEPYTAACFEMWESDQKVFVNEIKSDEVEDFFSTWSELLSEAESLKAANFPDGLYYAEAYMKYGCFGINIRRELTADEQDILHRFAVEFQRTYTRFLDLKKAEKQSKRIETINQENERLLHSILPAQIAEQIRSGQQTVVKRFEEVSILFADIVGFTVMSESMEPDKVVNILNGLFSSFDDLTDKHGLEKIKTIGDAYMVAAGVPNVKKDHASTMFLFAQEMLQALKIYNRENDIDLNLRIGISSGPVVAGVIGKKKFAYDLWGDTVNTAARMEAYGKEGKIQVSPTCYELLKSDYDFEVISDVPIKGKGMMDVYVW